MRSFSQSFTTVQPQKQCSLYPVCSAPRHLLVFCSGSKRSPKTAPFLVCGKKCNLSPPLSRVTLLIKCARTELLYVYQPVQLDQETPFSGRKVTLNWLFATRVCACSMLAALFFLSFFPHVHVLTLLVAFRFVHEDVMADVLDCLYMEELCALLRISSWFRSQILSALQRRKCVLPDVRHQKWRKTCSVVMDSYHYRTNFDGRDKKAWRSGYVAAIIRYCKHVEVVESGILAKERFLLKRTDTVHFKGFTKEVRFSWFYRSFCLFALF